MYDERKGPSQNRLKQKRRHFFSLSLDPLPPQKTKKHEVKASVDITDFAVSLDAMQVHVLVDKTIVR
jgi:hypothetical protein